MLARFVGIDKINPRRNLNQVLTFFLLICATIKCLMASKKTIE